MRREYLLFQLFGPLAAFGDIALGEMRQAFERPGKSALAGLLAACLGIRLDEDARYLALCDSLGLAVRVDAAGAPMNDYHTAQVPSRKGKRRFRTRRDELVSLLEQDEDLKTVLSTRTYRQDALFTACVWLRSNAAPHSLAELQDALLRPRFTPYLGRKSCPPALPFGPKLGEFDSLAEAFAGYGLDPQVPGQLLRTRPGTAAVFFEQGAEGVAAESSFVRRDQPVSRRNRFQFRNRTEFAGSVPFPGLREG
jgi:CRISPR system Cascade subunit CasD